MIRVKEYNRVGIVIRDLKKAKRFYGEVLGLQSIPRPKFYFPGHWYQVGPSAQLHLTVMDETITICNIALEVENFEETLKTLGPETSRSWKDWRSVRISWLQHDFGYYQQGTAELHGFQGEVCGGYFSRLRYSSFLWGRQRRPNLVKKRFLEKHVRNAAA